jgi:hypothetical protein
VRGLYSLNADKIAPSRSKDILRQDVAAWISAARSRAFSARRFASAAVLFDSAIFARASSTMASPASLALLPAHISPPTPMTIKALDNSVKPLIT